MFADDIYTEPEGFEVDTLKCLGPLAPLAGIFEGAAGTDVHPVAEGQETDAYIEHMELQPIDPQTNGPQLLYGLRYHTHIRKPGAEETFHDQVGYWLYEPATGTVMQSLTIPRGQTALAMGKAAPDAREFELVASEGAISSAPFLEHAFKTVEYRIKVTIHADGTWSYDQDTVMQIKGRSEPFHHTDRHTLRKVADPAPNPMARAKEATPA